jgi:hypothetical protein
MLELKSNNFYQFKTTVDALGTGSRNQKQILQQVFKEIKNTVSQFTTEIDTL